LALSISISTRPSPRHHGTAMPPCRHAHSNIKPRGAGLIREGPCERRCIQYQVTFQSWVTRRHKRTDMKWFQRNQKPAICIFRIYSDIMPGASSTFKYLQSSAPKLFSTIPTNLGTTLATLCSMVQLHDLCHATPQAPLFRESRSQTALPSHSPNPTGTSMWPLLSVGRCWITHVANVADLRQISSALVSFGCRMLPG
jgi:hypothetical protein